MKTPKFVDSLKGAQRKIVVALLLTFTLTSFQAPTAYAVDSVDQNSFAHMVVAALTAGISTSDSSIVTPVTPEPTVQEVLLQVCEANGYGEECAKTLLGMLWNESSNISTAIGDHGKARGYFQIHYKLHNVSVECAEDLACSAQWTLAYLEAHSYPKYVAYAVQCHNSCNVNNGYAAKAFRNGKYFWNQPLEITQAAPIQLALK